MIAATSQSHLQVSATEDTLVQDQGLGDQAGLRKLHVRVSI